MKEIIVGVNDHGQRIDRFLRKYFENAPLSFIYKNLRKKNITVNGKKVKPEDMLSENDVIKFFISDEVIEKYRKKEKAVRRDEFPNIIYEDENIALIDKPAGILSHSTKEFEKNILDMFIYYLIQKKEYVPRLNKTFRPALCNRLDRNTSGILIGAKNADALREINAAIKNRDISKYYITLVHGKTKDKFSHSAYAVKNESRNRVRMSHNEDEGKSAVTHFKTLKTKGEYSILEVNLVTGRTHQIRSALKSMGYPVVGDRKYGQDKINKDFTKYGLNNQFLHSYKLKFNGLDKLSYLNGREFISPMPKIYDEILKDLNL